MNPQNPPATPGARVGDAADAEPPAAVGFRVGDLVEITDRGYPYDGRIGYVTEFDAESEYSIGLTVEGFLGLVWCSSGEIRRLDVAGFAAAGEVGA